MCASAIVISLTGGASVRVMRVRTYPTKYQRRMMMRYGGASVAVTVAAAAVAPSGDVITSDSTADR